uniref:Uncharacterized protein n=1 Tax=Pseudictyota dubia TaxID=2749911 RepID=A0A7R9Z6V8_9STRA|mmetsp:Transcript_27406/g.50909  ORF Transcript_27406/g.50909 Transcript_27406/m.50909 type:complete len:199 (+) Transcript_27406:60-656(+)
MGLKIKLFTGCTVFAGAMVNVASFQHIRCPLQSAPALKEMSTISLSMGIIDDLRLIFSEEGKQNRAAWDEREKAEMEAAQREIMERRRNPNKMEEYMEGIEKNRAKLQEEKEVYDFQQKVEEGYDPLGDWKRLRKEGKVILGDDLERDPTSSRLGSEGLQDVRVDERMPYIDQGYVDEDSDVMGKLFGVFGGKKKSEE